MPRHAQTRPTDHMEKLQKSIRANDLAVFKHILDTEGLPSARNNADVKLLKKALVYARPKMAQMLLDLGCRADKPFEKDSSALHLAATRRNCGKLVRRLLDRGARVGQKNRKGDTPLHVAFHLAEGKVVDLMLQRYLGEHLVNECNGIGVTFLHIAATRPCLGSVKCLLEIGNALVNCQVDKKAESPFAGFTPLHMAVAYNRPKVVELLLSYGADLWARDSHGSTPLLLALERHYVEMVDLLLAHDFKRENYANDSGLSHFMAACLGSDTTIVADYLSNPLNSKAALINERVDRYSDVTYPFKNYTPLHFAAECGRQETVRLLAENGARCRTRNNSGLVPGHLAVVDACYRAAGLFAMRCLRYNWSASITALVLADDQADEVATELDDDSGFFDGSENSLCSDSSYDSDNESICYYLLDDEDDAEFWEDDIQNYIL